MTLSIERIASRPYHKLSHDDKATIVAAYTAGTNGPELARKFDVDLSSVYSLLRRRGVPVRHVRESNKGNYSKLGESLKFFRPEQRRVVAELYSAGVKAKVLAFQFDCMTSTIIDTVRREGVAVRSASEERRKYHPRQDAFESAETDEAASYFVGLMMADGAVMQRSRHGWTMKISLSGADGKHLESLRRFLGSAPPLQWAAAKTSGWGGAESYSLTVNSQPLCRQLIGYGVIPRKSKRERARRIHRGPNARHFWRGVVDGDGFIYMSGKKPVIGLVGSRVLVGQFARFVRRLCPAKASVLPMHSIWRVETKGTFAVTVLRELYGGCTVALPRKLAIAKTILTSVP